SPQLPIWLEPKLLRTDALAERVAEHLGAARAIVLRGNGAITVGETLEEALVFAWFLEGAAETELKILATGLAPEPLSAQDATELASLAGRVVERLWEHLTAGDPE